MRGMDHYRDWPSLREIDTAAGTAKGAAFHAFKTLEATFEEGRDYAVLHADRDREAISELRARQRIYASSINVVLLSPGAAARIVAALSTPTR